MPVPLPYRKLGSYVVRFSAFAWSCTRKSVGYNTEAQTAIMRGLND